jgi:aminoglycoside 3-N-acetyltransferase
MTLKLAKRFVKDRLRSLDRLYARNLYAFDAPSLGAALRGLGIAPGDVVMVHSAYDAFRGFAGKPTDVLAVLEDAVGPAGTILMPSLPFTGTAVDYVRSGAVTDIARTPSRMGLLTELFRRQKGTLRSVHPTHPVLARGARAAELVAGHESARTPCGAGSPFAKLLEADGKMLFLGVSIDSMTFFHFLEEQFEDRLRPSPFTSETFEAPVQRGGETVAVHTRLFDPVLSRRRDIGVMLPELRRLGGLHEAKVGLLPLSMVRAASTRDAFAAVLDDGKSFYGLE